MHLTRLCLVRHGETAWNAERRLQGHLDIPLNENGERQAESTCDALAPLRFDAIYSSDLSRARATAEPAARRLGSTPKPLPGLRERHYGVFQGLTYEQARQQHPEAYALFEQRDPDFTFPGGGESLAGFQSRVINTLQAIAQAHRGEQILVVTHGGVLDIVHRQCTGKPLHTPRDFEIPNAALNWIAIGEARWDLIAWADRSHLHHTRDELPNG